MHILIANTRSLDIRKSMDTTVVLHKKCRLYHVYDDTLELNQNMMKEDPLNSNGHDRHVLHSLSVILDLSKSLHIPIQLYI